MYTLAVAAIIGAVLGLFVRPRLLGILVTVLLAVCIEGGVLLLIGMLEDQPNRELLIGRLQAVFGEGVAGAAGPVAAAFIGAVLAALMGKFSEPEGTPGLVTADQLRRKAGKNGRYSRVEGMVVEREVHARAESRIDSILGL
ncbi:hypothetical protein [Caulobacter henricii]|uniref:Uncharacterized protein n=1 Tax=Caulobacter henricii TaxID=69395 RepID=A0A0P0P2N4_9CAUL|nr:hypothetical protein [Caulobacter henricii]ALL14772.1 hypothetical protein AQ619_16160 [Caulobacter henricii]